MVRNKPVVRYIITRASAQIRHKMQIYTENTMTKHLAYQTPEGVILTETTYHEDNERYWQSAEGRRTGLLQVMLF